MSRNKFLKEQHEILKKQKSDSISTQQVNKSAIPSANEQPKSQVNKQVPQKVEEQTTPENKAASKNSFLRNEHIKLKAKQKEKDKDKTVSQVNNKTIPEENTKVSEIIKETPKFKDNYKSPIPKIMHRIWMTFDPEHPEIPEKYKKADVILKSLHSDWICMEWNDETVLNFVHDYYPEFYPTYISYPEPVMRHDVARYLILKHFGGAFIQHSFVFQKNIEPLLGSYDLVFSTKMDHIKLSTPDREGELANNWMASTPNHPFCDNLISSLIETAKNPPSNGKNFVMSVTGPFILTNTLKEYQKEKQDSSIHVLHYKYLMPFYAFEQNEPVIKANCVDSMNALDLNKCFSIFPNAYAYTSWSASWTLKSHKKASIDLSLLDTTSEQPSYTKLFVMNLKRSSDRWAKISYDLYNNGIKFERFQAADGYQAKILDPETGQSFRGIDIKRKVVELSNDKFYKITCDNGLSKTLDIKLKSDGAKLIAGNIGVWCTKALIREEIIKNAYNHTIILEDDFEFNSKDLMRNINNFISALPEYDIAYLHNYIKNRDELVSVNDFISAPTLNSIWFGDWAHMLSAMGAQKLNLGYEFIGPSDDYSRKLALGKITKPEISEFKTYFAKYNFSMHNDWYYTGHNPNSESTKMGCRDFHPSNPRYCNFNDVTPDQVYVMNLKDKKDRLDLISQSLNNYGIHFTKFEAVNGVDIKITSIEDGIVFYGQDLYDRTSKLNKDKQYKITCNPKDQIKTEFTSTGYINNNNLTISAGEIGLWCSNVMIWEDAQKNSYNRILVLEDDVSINFKSNQELNDFYVHLPRTFDLAYLDFKLFTGKNSLIPINQFVNDFKTVASGSRAHSVLLSANGVDKLLSLKNGGYKYPIDHFYFCYNTGKMNVFNYHPNSECNNYVGYLNTYASSRPLVTLNKLAEDSCIDAMGRNLNQIKLTDTLLDKETLYIPKIIHRICMIFDSKNQTISTKYKEYDTILVNLHPDWEFREWDKQSVYNLVHDKYPEFLLTYNSYDMLKQHEVASYLIANQFGGVFIQHSIKLQKNLTPLLQGFKAIFSLQNYDSNNLVTGFFATTEKHPIWEIIKEDLSKTSSEYITLATGPKFLANEVHKYKEIQPNHDVKILAHQHLFPFDWIDSKENTLIKENCIEDESKCFDLFPESYGFCSWSGSCKIFYDN